MDTELAAPVNVWTPVGLALPVEYGAVEFFAGHGAPVGLAEVEVGQIEVVVLTTALVVTTLAGALDDGVGVEDEDLESCAAQDSVESPFGQQLPLVKQKLPLGQAQELLQQVWPALGL